ncbi:ATP-binding cassette domain-containing protein [Actinomadura sp. KC345]|uniref:ABC transporter ATP-binding protein n=1 Tax=Actinomadura sp. KC345 TaxID=2530371 RepID=UPI0010488691|nr:ATP-binding cassette domain-containing protein [Actinomadura sp. KC345]TDC57442.1 ATP-binding cassette domain-containing protein [Actinomadura sp. KC345]
MNDEKRGHRLDVDGVDVHLGGVQILRGVTFDVRPGEVFGIVGPNGAGKTTILNVVDGIVRPTAGTVRYGEVDLRRVRPHRMRDHGIGRSLQSTHYFRDLTALQLVALGELPNTVAGALRFGGHRRRRAKDAARDRSAAVLREFGLERYAHRPLGELSSAVQKLADIARAVVAGSELLLLDEPTSGVSGQERGEIGEALHRLRELGRTIVLIDHDPGFVTGNCDRLMAMNFGEVLHVGLPDEVMGSDVVKRSYLGEAAEGVGQ